MDVKAEGGQVEVKAEGGQVDVKAVRVYTLLKLITCHKRTGTRYINQWLFVMTV